MNVELKLKFNIDSLRGFWNECAKDMGAGKKETCGITASVVRYGENSQTFDMYKCDKIGSSVSPETVDKRWVIHDKELYEELKKGELILDRTVPEHVFQNFWPSGIYNGVTHSHPSYDKIHVHHSLRDFKSYYSTSKRLAKAKSLDGYSLLSFIVPVFADVEIVFLCFQSQALAPNANINLWRNYHYSRDENYGALIKGITDLKDKLRENVSLGRKIDALLTLKDMWGVYKRIGIVSGEKIPGSCLGILGDWLNREELMWHVAENDLFDDEWGFSREYLFDPLIFSLKGDDIEVAKFEEGSLSFYGRKFNYPDVLGMKKNFRQIFGRNVPKDFMEKELHGRIVSHEKTCEQYPTIRKMISDRLRRELKIEMTKKDLLSAEEGLELNG